MKKNIHTTNKDLESLVSTDSKLKETIVNYVGEKLNPDTDEITVENVISVFADEFPEFLLAVAEENWVNGYTQALNDVEFVSKQKKQNEKIHKK